MSKAPIPEEPLPIFRIVPIFVSDWEVQRRDHYLVCKGLFRRRWEWRHAPWSDDDRFHYRSNIFATEEEAEKFIDLSLAEHKQSRINKKIVEDRKKNIPPRGYP